MRIGGPARRHGIPDADIWHGVRNATHKIDIDDDLTMLIGPARDGAPLELGALGLDSADPVIIHALPLRAKFYRFLGGGDHMKHSDAEIEEAARRFEALADELDPEAAEVEDLADLRAIAEAAERTRRDEALLTERVALARAHGRSWNRIAAALGVSRQAARQRFGGKVGA
jgi:hypothetical protein